MPSFEVFEVVLVQCNLLDNQCQQKSEVLYTFTPNKPYAYLLNVEPSNFLFPKTCNTEFDEIIITFTDQNGRPLEIEDKVKATDEFIGNKIAAKIVKPKHLFDENPRNV